MKTRFARHCACPDYWDRCPNCGEPRRSKPLSLLGASLVLGAIGGAILAYLFTR
jgi:hypothetical protein